MNNRKEYMKNYRKTAKFKKVNKEYQKKYKEKTDYNKIYYEKNKEDLQDKSKKWQEENKEKRRDYLRVYNKKNKSKIKDYKKNWASINKEKIKKRLKKYYSNQEVKKSLVEKQKRRMESDKEFALTIRLRTLLRKALNKYSKTGKTMESKKYGINYGLIIENLKPIPKNLKDYHIDHIMPLCSFNLNNEDEIKRAFAPENHQLLIAVDNLKKGGSVPC